MNARFNLPDFIIGEPIYTTLVEQQKQYPEIILPNTEIHAIFGIFPGAIWNGGGITVGGSWTRERMESLIHHYNFDLNLPLRFTFTNPFVSEEQCHDTYCNIIAELGHNGKNQILVVNPVLERYLRKNYPNYKYCRSIVGARDIPYQLHGPLGDYYLTVMRRRMNNNWEFLDTIPDIERPNIEFLTNDPCPDNCPRLYTHYRDFARAQLELRECGENTQCSMNEVKGPFPNHNMMHNLETYISRQMIDNDYLPKGFCEFKCSGRQSTSASLGNLLQYVINPEYFWDFFYLALASCGIE